jgi:hypothetical protein
MLVNDYSGQETENAEVQVVDLMPDELLGQNQDIKSDYKSDIRQAYGISDIHDSDLEDAGGLNNEGLQLEVVDRSLASQMHDYRQGWLDTLMKRLGFEGYRIEFLPDRGADADQLQDNLKAAAFVKQAGGDAEVADDGRRLEVSDFEVELDDSDDPPALQGTPNLPGVGSPVPEGGEGGPAGADAGAPGAGMAADTDPRETVDALEHALLRTLAPEAPVGQKGQPVYQSRDDVPPNVQQRIAGAVRAHDFSPVESLSTPTVQTIFEESLTQPQGWSVDSIAARLEAAGAEPDVARTTARTESAAILNAAREDAVGELAETLDETVLHYWDGPQDEDTTDICRWLKEQTNPEYGGEPVPMDELHRLQQEALDKFTEDGSGASDVRDHVLHASERHTHRSILESEVDT